MTTTYKPIDRTYFNHLKALADSRAGVRLQYYTDIREFITQFVTLKGLATKGEEEYLLLASGEEVRLDRIVRVDDKPAPGYDEDYFQCDIGPRA
ncbi:Rho-binding antiterminator [Pontibacter mucosus]|uniref:Rho-binding antiterminator n=1 Tax=Pontibacter mucosus TaxID=1649266 RepID=A0A2T5YQE5_9BACT|nr:hypothetical protein [Pontibacter mucosus]PTX21530.1 Rho-binding antiterminator [Pontibacter mucosus]